MIFRSFLAVLAGIVMVASPAAAKSKPPIAAPAPALPTLVDPDPANAPQDVLLLDLSNGGSVMIRLMPQWAPAHVERIKTLVGQGFYDGVIFHRVIEGFMAQTGDPTGTGASGSKLPDLKAEFNAMPHLRGTVSAARTSDPDTANSQFFIVFYPRFSLDRKYTVFGRVISGMEVVDRIERGEPPTSPTRILRARMAAGGAALPVSPPPAEEAISANDLINSTSD